MAHKPTAKQKFQYWFDNFMSGGTIALIGGLAVISLGVILLAAAVIRLGSIGMEGEQAPSFFEAAWLSLMRTLDAGTMGGDTGIGFRLVMLSVTLGGIFIVSTLIGVLSNGLEDRLEELRKGRSLVLENGHTLILGWSPQIFTILSELMTANENQSNARIVILADKDKVEMEDEIAERVEMKGRTKIICRSGSPIDLNDVEIVSPHQARAIIILPDGDDPDSYVIKATLAVTNNPNRHPEPYHIVTQIRDPRNINVVKMIGQKDIVQPILTSDLIARVVAQTSRQSGLSLVYTELMNFGGDEIYFKNEPTLSGKTYGDAILMYEDSCVMGIRRADGAILMNPPADTRIQAGDQIFALSADDDTIRIANTPGQVDTSAFQTGKKTSAVKAEKCLILGWNEEGAVIIRELDNYVPKGSQVTVVANIEGLDKQIRTQSGKLKNQKVSVMEGDITDRDLLESLNIEDYDHVIALAYHHLEVQAADAITLVTLLHLRDIAERDETPFSIVSEMLDVRNRELAEAAKVDDFIVSDHLISLMMSQLSENHELFAVFNDVFDPEGSEIYLKPISDYVQIGKPVNFYTVADAARKRNETVLGYRLMSEAGDSAKAYGVHTNPKKSEKVTFTADDKVIVIAEG
jgi:Trk K+ transport system NAD-binding subunit